MSGELLSITIAPGYGMDLVSLASASLVEGHGIEGDRYFGTTRQVTVVCTGEVAKAESERGLGPMDPAHTRRNLVIDTDEIPRAHGTRIRIGQVELAVWRDCAPCEQMNDIFGDGARAALKERAGVSARVVRGGTITVGDPVNIEPVVSEQAG